jgi:hypothetical protein
MATRPRFDTRPVHGDGAGSTRDEPQMRDLLRQLAGEGGDLLRNEMALAKLEMRGMAREIALDSARVGGALALAFVGALALVAAAIIGLGTLLGGMYALAALIVGVVFLLTGGILARSGIAGLKNPPKPEETARSMRRNREWASQEIQQFKEEIRS